MTKGTGSREQEMSDDVVEFFEELGRRGHEPLLAKITGRVRFNLVDGGRPDRWSVAVDKGDTTVMHDGGPADCTIRAERALFERLCRGEENAMAAVLRGALVCTGDVELLYAIQRIFPGPPRERPAVRGAEGSR
jgi:putative sterol carrier protein